MSKIFLLTFLGLFCFFSCMQNSSKNVKSLEKDTAVLEEKDTTASGNDVEKANVEVSPSTEFLEEILDNWLGKDVNEQLVLEKLGRPDSLGPDECWDALGTHVQKWVYTKEGVALDMESEKKHSPKHVLLITIKPPCKMTTQQGVGIGTSKDDVEKAYNSLIDHYFSNDSIIVVGSIYGGAIFHFSKGVVSEIFLGAAAE